MCFVGVVVFTPPYTQPQMANKVYTDIQETGLFLTTCLHWNTMAGDRWSNLKDHVTKAYIAWLYTQHGQTRPSHARSTC